jgi:MIP family channel proteins
MDPRIRPYLAELFGTFLLVLIGAGTVCSTFLAEESRFHPVGGITLTVALAEGFALAALLTAALYHSPGCLNPAFTLALWVIRRIEGSRALGLVAAQLLGAILGGLVVRVLFSDQVLQAARMGTPHLKALLSTEGTVTLAGIASGVGLEMLFTFFLTVTLFATLFDPRAPRTGGLLVGLAQSAVILFGYHLTGGAANPARWFGAWVWELTIPPAGGVSPWADHTVYWVGPTLGSLLGCLFYGAVIRPPGDSPAVPPGTRTR